MRQAAGKPPLKGETQMKQQVSSSTGIFRAGCRVLALAVGLSLGWGAAVHATAAPAAKSTKAAKPKRAAPAVTMGAQLGQPIHATVGKSVLLRLPAPVSRISVGNPAVADITLISQREVYLVGKSIGTTNIILWGKGGGTTIIDVSVSMDNALFKRLMPSEKGIRVDSAGDNIVLTGMVSDAVKADQAVTLAEAHGAKRVINMLRVKDPQQVLLEVKIAEVSKTLIDQIGARAVRRTNGPFIIGGTETTPLSGSINSFGSFLTDTNGVLSWIRGGTSITLDGQRDNTLIKVLAEPNIMAISGQEGAFLSGGKIFIPVPQSSSAGGTVITLQEEDFGIGLRFLPTVLENGRINLRVTPEVSEVSATGTSVTSGGVTSVLPTITTNRAATTIQLNDGQTFAIGGLIKNNVTTSLSAFPGLGEIPILGALFRSTSFRNDKTELLFVVTPHLVKPLPPDYKLPTDSFVPPTRSELFLGGQLEGGHPLGTPEPKAEEPAKAAPGAPAAQPSGYEMK
jgi:pilus assembly protein CpaC